MNISPDDFKRIYAFVDRECRGKTVPALIAMLPNYDGDYYSVILGYTIACIHNDYPELGERLRKEAYTNTKVEIFNTLLSQVLPLYQGVN